MVSQSAAEDGAAKDAPGAASAVNPAAAPNNLRRPARNRSIPHLRKIDIADQYKRTAAGSTVSVDARCVSPETRAVV
jgi:hypothetical protein